MKVVKAKYQIWKRKQTETYLTQFQLFIFSKHACLQKKFTEEYNPSGYFPRTGTMGW